VIVDRLVDIPIMLHHHSDYRPLIHDCLGIHVNAVTLPGATANDTITWPLVEAADSFWRENAPRAFPHVVKDLEQSLFFQNTPARQGAAGTAGTSGRQGPPAPDPEMRHAFQRRVLGTHAKIVSLLAKHIEKRALDDFFELEADILARPTAPDLDAAEDLLSGFRVAATTGDDDDAPTQRLSVQSTPADRMRLFLILYLCCPSLDEDILQTFVGYLGKAGADMRVFRHLLHVKRRHPWVGSRPPSSIVSGLLAAGADKLKKLVRERHAGQLATTVRNLLRPPDEDDAALGAGVGALRGLPSAASASSCTPQFSYIDPFRDRGEEGGEPDHIMTFVVGGGNYVEMQDLKTTLAQCGWHSVYGTTDMVNPEQFLSQLCESTER